MMMVISVKCWIVGARGCGCETVRPCCSSVMWWPLSVLCEIWSEWDASQSVIREIRARAAGPGGESMAHAGPLADEMLNPGWPGHITPVSSTIHYTQQGPDYSAPRPCQSNSMNAGSLSQTSWGPTLTKLFSSHHLQQQNFVIIINNLVFILSSFHLHQEN